ncbi:hypothetical protein DI487_09475 [Flavobacterium sediminis]|uniref:Uncharacterized protein n=1 Tax=Flavobacterium sediminis TaxID=2201181 RepID=A0A2U8QVB0_9FLAO|nr:hypothetical protein DI487_09475 [Flavobacterium sediminis]
MIVVNVFSTKEISSIRHEVLIKGKTFSICHFLNGNKPTTIRLERFTNKVLNRISSRNQKQGLESLVIEGGVKNRLSLILPHFIQYKKTQ